MGDRPHCFHAIFPIVEGSLPLRLPRLTKADGQRSVQDRREEPLAAGYWAPLVEVVLRVKRQQLEATRLVKNVGRTVFERC